MTIRLESVSLEDAQRVIAAAQAKPESTDELVKVDPNRRHEQELFPGRA